MKKFLIFLFLILFSCQPDEILLPSPEPIQEMIFEYPTNIIVDGQDISFIVSINETHQLIITTHDGSVISKERFTPEIGLNTRKIYTKSLPKNEYFLILTSNDEVINKTNIIIE